MSQFYYYVWALYASAALGFLYLGWLMFRRIKMPAVVLALMALLTAILFTPAKIIPEQQDLTPALMIAVLDGSVAGWAGAWNGLKYILLVFVGLLLLLVLGYSIRAVFRPKQIHNKTAE